MPPEFRVCDRSLDRYDPIINATGSAFDDDDDDEGFPNVEQSQNSWTFFGKCLVGTIVHSENRQIVSTELGSGSTGSDCFVQTTGARMSCYVVVFCLSGHFNYWQ